MNSKIASNNSNSNDVTTAEAVQATTENFSQNIPDDIDSDETKAETSEPSTNAETTTDNSDENDTPRETEAIIVPKSSEGGEEGKFFNASYVPSYAVDSASGERVSLKDVFGSSYLGGVLTFNDDGTFTDTLTLSSVDSGAYAVEGNTITVTYSNDKNLYITVSEWNNDEPAAFVIYDFGGYDIYFEQ